ncbi:MAG: flagellar motor protein MotB [Elusimicrobia bacterium]|nr:flagellar motor protein MotB [Elusimicrobiota bacterium]
MKLVTVGKFGVLVGFVGLVLGTGCVSSGKYKKVVTDNDGLKAQLTDSTAKAAELEKGLAQAQREKDALVEQSKQSQANYNQLVGQLSKEVEQGQLKVTQYKNMLTVDVAEQIFFDSGSAKMKPSGADVLKKLGDTLKQYEGKIIRVVGHTDNVPLGKSSREFPTNWELSAIRATNVVRFLEEKCAIDPKLLITSGRGEHQPVAPNDTPEGRQKNRRIEIMLLDKSMVEAMTAATGN